MAKQRALSLVGASIFGPSAYIYLVLVKYFSYYREGKKKKKGRVSKGYHVIIILLSQHHVPRVIVVSYMRSYSHVGER